KLNQRSVIRRPGRILPCKMRARYILDDFLRIAIIITDVAHVEKQKYMRWMVLFYNPFKEQIFQKWRIADDAGIQYCCIPALCAKQLFHLFAESRFLSYAKAKYKRVAKD